MICPAWESYLLILWIILLLASPEIISRIFMNLNGIFSTNILGEEREDKKDNCNNGTPFLSSFKMDTTPVYPVSVS